MKRNTTYTCEYCGGPVDVSVQSAAIFVQGWIIRRSGGGPNQVRGWKPLGKVAHGSCLDEMLSPVDANQQVLL